MIIYLATNRRNGLRYVGATTLTITERQTQHRRTAHCNGQKPHSRFHMAIRQHGYSAFDWVILARCNDVTELRTLECYWITIYGTTDPAHGYNMTKGGSGVIGYVFSDSARAKISQAGKGRIKSAETRRKLSVANKGKRPSDAAMDALRGRVWTADMRRRSSDSHKRLWLERRASS